MTNYFDVMVDVECLGGPPNGALVQIGAVFFDIKTRSMGPTFLENINLADAVRHGGVIDAATCMWWMGQPDKAREGIRFGGSEIAVVLQRFSDWIKQTCRHEDVRPWGNSASFDLPLIDSACQRVGLAPPWHWINQRCFRTTRFLYPKVEYDTSEKGDDAHNALADAKFQVRHLFKIADSRRA